MVQNLVCSSLTRKWSGYASSKIYYLQFVHIFVCCFPNNQVFFLQKKREISFLKSPLYITLYKVVKLIYSFIHSPIQKEFVQHVLLSHICYCYLQNYNLPYKTVNGMILLLHLKLCLSFHL